MPGLKHVKIIIKPDGTCSVDAVNFADATCTYATQQIMSALAGQIVQERLKPEAQRLPTQSTLQREVSR